MLREVGKQRSPGGGDLRRDAPPLLCQVQAQHPPVDSILPALDPASPLEIGDQTADRALLEPETAPELTLGQCFAAGELGQRMGHRSTHRLAAWRPIDVEQPEGPHEADHPTLEQLAIAHTPSIELDQSQHTTVFVVTRNLLREAEAESAALGQGFRARSTPSRSRHCNRRGFLRL